MLCTKPCFCLLTNLLPVIFSFNFALSGVGVRGLECEKLILRIAKYPLRPFGMITSGAKQKDKFVPTLLNPMCTYSILTESSSLLMTHRMKGISSYIR